MALRIWFLRWSIHGSIYHHDSSDEYGHDLCSAPTLLAWKSKEILPRSQSPTSITLKSRFISQSTFHKLKSGNANAESRLTLPARLERLRFPCSLLWLGEQPQVYQQIFRQRSSRHNYRWGWTGDVTLKDELPEESEFRRRKRLPKHKSLKGGYPGKSDLCYLQSTAD